MAAINLSPTASSDMECYTDWETVPKYDEKNMSDGEFEKLKSRLEKAVPKICPSGVAMNSFVGLEEVKEDVMTNFDCDFKQCDRILFYGPTGSGKSHLARALSTELNALLFAIDKSTFHGWSRNVELFTKIFSQIVGDCGNNESGPVVLLLESFDWFYSTSKEMNAVVDLLNSVQSCWTKHSSSSSSKLIIMACSYTPCALDKTVIDAFHKKVYLRPLNLQERKQLILKKASDLLHQWGLNMSERELGEVAKRAERFAGWEICEMVEKAYRLQCPSHIKRHIAPRPLTKVDFEVTLDRMTAGGNGRGLLKKFEEFNKTYGNGATGQFEDKGIQVEMNKGRKARNVLSKFLAHITI